MLLIRLDLRLWELLQLDSIRISRTAIGTRHNHIRLLVYYILGLHDWLLRGLLLGNVHNLLCFLFIGVATFPDAANDTDDNGDAAKSESDEHDDYDCFRFFIGYL